MCCRCDGMSALRQLRGTLTLRRGMAGCVNSEQRKISDISITIQILFTSIQAMVYDAYYRS